MRCREDHEKDVCGDPTVIVSTSLEAGSKSWGANSRDAGSKLREASSKSLEVGSKSREANSDEAKPGETSSAGKQTAISLPHTMRDVLWTASSFEPMIDLDQTNNQNDEISVGSGVLDIDMLSKENEEKEVMIHGMKAHEFYTYIFTLIISFHIFGKKTEDADETNDAKLRLRGRK